MDLNDFSDKSQRYISKLISQTTFDLDDKSRFGIVKEPVKLNEISFQPYFFKILTGYKPNKQCEIPVLYTFFILTPPKDIKQKFLDELNKKKSGQKYDQKVISHYYIPVNPMLKDFKELTNDLANSLETFLFKDKGYKFSFHLVCPTAAYNFALVFIEVNSAQSLEKIYPDKVPFDI